MISFYLVMIVGACLGAAGLYLISGDLARRFKLTGGGRWLLAAAFGFGVISAAVKILIVSVLLPTTETPAAALRPQPWSDAADLPPSAGESIFTAPWRTLPPAPAGLIDDARTINVVNLGRLLFNDPALSKDDRIACSSCHRLDAGGADRAAVSLGVSGFLGSRNAPTVWNAAYLSRLFLDGRAASLEEQAKGPLINPVEMGMPSYAAVEQAVRAKPAYAELFERAYGPGGATIDNIADAIATYERTLTTPDTHYDRFVRGDAAALTPAQIRGMALFAGLGCRMCHRDPTFSAAGVMQPAGVYRTFPVFLDNQYVEKYDLISDQGARTTGPGFASPRPGLWRVPSLRNVANTAPYFHNGRVDSLEEAIRVMAVSQLGRRLSAEPRKETPAIHWDGAHQKLSVYRPAALTSEDIADIAAFLRAISLEEKAAPIFPGGVN